MDDTDLAILESNNADLSVLSATYERLAELPTISSTAFPKVAFRRPPSVWPSFTESSSVAKLNKDARGMMAKKFRKKMTVGGQCMAPAMIPNGTKTSKTFTQLLAKTCHDLCRNCAGQATYGL